MSLTNTQMTEIEEILKQSLRHKFMHYNPEPAVMPFHTRLLGKDRMALFSFIHSLNTNFGTTVFESVAVAFAKTAFKSAEKQQTAGKTISSEAQNVIQTIMDDLTTGRILRRTFDASNMRHIFKRRSAFQSSSRFAACDFPGRICKTERAAFKHNVVVPVHASRIGADDIEVCNRFLIGIDGLHALVDRDSAERAQTAKARQNRVVGSLFYGVKKFRVFEKLCIAA